MEIRQLYKVGDIGALWKEGFNGIAVRVFPAGLDGVRYPYFVYTLVGGAVTHKTQSTILDGTITKD